ncbi:MAG: hypothetical protein IJ124_10565 [Clostridia bacterium]|nr:hypothetical protein [Clostridia bacterium]MBQ9721372.1 hypothetical protein [Oscillospiraceae bacterium]
MFRRIQKLLSALLIATLIASAMVPAVAESVTARVSSSSAKIYQSASSSSRHVSLKKGTKVTVKSVSGSWAKVKISGKTGYMPVKYLSAASSSSSSSSSSSRYTAYISKSTYIYEKASSSSSRYSVSPNTKVYVVGKSGDYFKVQNSKGSATGYVKTGCVSRSKVSADTAKSAGSSSWKSKVVKLQWFKDGKNVLKKGSYGYIYDIDTGIELKIKRMGGHYHADVEPATITDTAKLLRVAGGHFSWKSHAVILKAGGKYVACGINTEPHGDQTIKSNGYNGQFCLHMVGSWTHASSKENDYHQSSIERAYRWAHK